MNKSIKFKIISATALIVLITLIFSSSFAYLYFNNLLKNQIIKDNKIKLNQMAKQMEYFTEDILNYSYNIVIDSDIQEFLKKSNKKDIFDKVIYVDKLKTKLSQYVALRHYLHSISIITTNGEVYWNRSPYDEYFKKKLEEEWYKTFKYSTQSTYFSGFHNISDQGSSKTIMSFIIRINEINDPNNLIGELILNIYAEHFLNLVKEASKEYDDFFWVSKDKLFLYRNIDVYSGNMLLTIQDYISKYIKKLKYNDVALEETKKYILCLKQIKNGWIFVTVTDKKNIARQTSFVIYFFLCFILFSLFLIVSIISPIVHNIIKPIHSLVNAMQMVSSGDLDIKLKINSNDEMNVLCNGFNHMVEELKKYINQSVEDEKTRRKIELELLLAQINPHFIYNTLHTVIYLARKSKNYDIVEMVNSLIYTLQDAVKIGEKGMLSTIKSEINLTEHYLVIQKYRYRDRFEIKWEIDESLLDCLVPKTILQPLVENSLLHGIMPKQEKGIIEISIYEDGKVMLICVSDNGVGMEKQTIDKILEGSKEYVLNNKIRSIGIANVNSRIKHIYGDEYGVEIYSEMRKGTKVIVKIPRKHDFYSI